MPRIRLLAVVLVAALTAVACGGSEDEDVAATVSDQLDFTAPDVRGGQVVGAEFAGQDVVVWFWAPW